ncbi:MAG TPA: polysaccharide lyase 6 family protein [Polyangiaceae bacterium]|jgi:hypothetical protein
MENLRRSSSLGFLGFVGTYLLCACGGGADATNPAVSPPAADGAAPAPGPAAPNPEPGDGEDAGPGVTDDGGASDDGGEGPGNGGGETSDAGDALPPCKRVVNVSSTSTLNTAISAAAAGDCITLADGDYAFNTVGSKGTAANPIVIRAKNLGKATVSTKNLALSGAAYVVVQGLLYTSSEGVSLANCDHCRLTRNTFHINETGPISWIQTSGSKGGHNRIDHNELGPKTHEGNLIGLYGSGQTILPYTQIDHNYFHDVGPVVGNGWETIRAGLSGLSHSSGYVTIEYNLFQNTQGDPEVISTKSCDDVVRYNTLRECKGQISIRIGSRNSVYGNYILGNGVAGTGGIRIHGQDHKVYDNYVEAVDDNGVILEGGESEETPQPGAFHYRIYRAQVVYNTIVNAAKAGIQIGGAHPLSPVDCTVANNVVQSTKGAMIRESLSPVNTTYLANIVNPTGSATLGLTATAAQMKKEDPLLVKVGEVLKLSAKSPAIGAASGSFPFVTDDIDGDSRTTPDVGADEYSTAPTARHPLTTADVGPAAP